MTPGDSRSELQVLARSLLQPREPIPVEIVEHLEPIRGIRAILFDVYGTLLVSVSGDIGSAEDDPGGAEAAFRAAAGDAGLSVAGDAPLDVQARWRSAVRARHTERRAHGVEHPEIDVRDAWTELCREWAIERRLERAPEPDAIERLALSYECRTNPVWPMPGFPRIIADLRPRMRVGIVSNAQFYTPILLEELGRSPLDRLGVEPDLCAWSFEHGVAKPSPALLGKLVERLFRDGIRPHEIAVVGNDASKDIAPARWLGVAGILFAGDRRSLRYDGEAVADPNARPSAIIRDLRSLPDLLSAQRA